MQKWWSWIDLIKGVLRWGWFLGGFRLHVLSMCHHSSLLDLQRLKNLSISFFGKLGVSPPESNHELGMHVPSIMASCLWLCHRMTDTVEFFFFLFFFPKSWPGIKLWRESFGHTGARVRSAAWTSLFHSLWWLESKGRFSAWPAFALACSGPSYCCCCCVPMKPQGPLHSSVLPPNSSQRQTASGAFCQSSRRNSVRRGACWSWGHFGCSGSWLVMQPVLRSAIMLQEECGLLSLQSAWARHLGLVIQTKECSPKICFHIINYCY